mmetsp:Transcript_33194/g.75857  ORF Transcript_33194/g.75857 Transcript_33194/m.75857 type:complete len:303 (-) Transcript_33194:891-1799(-)
MEEAKGEAAEGVGGASAASAAGAPSCGSSAVSPAGAAPASVASATELLCSPVIASRRASGAFWLSKLITFAGVLSGLSNFFRPAKSSWLSLSTLATSWLAAANVCNSLSCTVGTVNFITASSSGSVSSTLRAGRTAFSRALRRLSKSCLNSMPSPNAALVLVLTLPALPPRVPGSGAASTSVGAVLSPRTGEDASLAGLDDLGGKHLRVSDLPDPTLGGPSIVTSRELFRGDPGADVADRLLLGPDSSLALTGSARSDSRLLLAASFWPPGSIRVADAADASLVDAGGAVPPNGSLLKSISV